MKDNFFYIWLGWGILSAASFLFLKYYRNARVKRVVYPLMIVVTTGAFLFIVWSMTGPRADGFLIVFSLFAVGIGISNWRSTVFCDECGAMSYSSVPFRRPNECAVCGSKWV